MSDGAWLVVGVAAALGYVLWPRKVAAVPMEPADRDDAYAPTGEGPSMYAGADVWDAEVPLGEGPRMFSSDVESDRIAAAVAEPSTGSEAW
jgi:hypothetical protein